jgi:DNA polymerase-3 subunit delta'
VLNSFYPWLKHDWAQLNDYILQQRVPQALLIIGKQGLGKQQLANLFAASLLCNNPHSNGFNCGHCQSCLLLKAETHPDFIEIKPAETKKSISVDQIRNLVIKLSLKRRTRF